MDYVTLGTDQRRVLLSISVEIGDGHVEYIDLREGDMAEEVSRNFCTYYQIPPHFIAPLAEHILDSLLSIRSGDADMDQRALKAANTADYPMREDAHDEKRRRSCFAKSNTFQDSNKIQAGQPAKRSVKETISASRAVKKLRKSKSFISRRLSERLLSPTYSFSTKMLGKPKAKKERQKHISDPLPDHVKAICIRLYSEFLKQRQRIEEGSRLCQQTYKEKLEREKPVCSKISRKLMRSRIREAKQFRNYGELLYQEAAAKQRQRKILIEKKQEEDKLNELKELTLKPKISNLAKKTRISEAPVWERLLNHRPNLEHMQEIRNELWEAKYMECTFRPQIKHLKFFKHGRDVAGSRFEHLFYDAEHRRRRQAEYLQWYPEGYRMFVSWLQKFSEHIHGQGDYPPGETVFDRLMQYASKLTEKKQKLKQQYLKDPTDPMTGQKLFNPVTGRKPHYDRNRAALPIGEFLYQLHMILDRKKSLLAEKLMRERMQGSKGHFVLRKSERLVQNLKIRQLKKIFDYLDTDKDGIVDMDSLDRRHIPYDLIRKFEGLRDLEGFESRLSLQKFIHLMLSAQRRTGDALRALRERSPRNDNYQMSFRMCRYSRILSTQSRKYNTKKQWLKIIAADIHRRQQKVESLRRESIGREMAECTFQPATRWRTDGKTHYGSHKHFHRKSSMLDKGDEEVHGFIFQEPSQSSRPSRRLSQIQEELG